MVRAPTASGLGLLLVLIGVGFDTPSLLIPGIGLIVIVVIAVAWVELARPATVERRPGPPRVVEGERYPVEIRAGGGSLRPPAGELSDPLLESPLPIGPRWDGALVTSVSLRGRGRRRLGPPRLEIRDPLGVHARAVAGEGTDELIVLPRIEPVLVVGSGTGASRRSVLAGVEEGAAQARVDARAIELEVDGLRPYREGSPASRIHWPSVARGRELVERRMAAGADAAPLVVLDASAPESAAALDAAVRAAASLAFHLAHGDGCVVLLPGGRRALELDPGLHRWPEIHARFALVEETEAPPALRRTLRPGAVFWVAARPSSIPAALRGSPAPRYLVAPEAAAAGAPVFSVAGLEAVRVGSRRQIRRAA